MLLNAGEGEGKVGTAPTVGRVFLHHCTYHPVVLNNSSALLPNCEFSQGPSLSSPPLYSQHLSRPGHPEFMLDKQTGSQPLFIGSLHLPRKHPPHPRFPSPPMGYRLPLPGPIIHLVAIPVSPDKHIGGITVLSLYHYCNG